MRHYFIPVFYSAIELGSALYWNVRPDDAAKHRAHVFLLRPEIFKTLSGDRRDKIFMSVAGFVCNALYNFEEELKGYRANFLEKQTVLNSYAAFRERYLQALIDFIKETIQVLGKKDLDRISQLQTTLDFLENKEVMFQYHADRIVALHQGKISSQAFIIGVLPEEHSTSIVDQLDSAQPAIKESTSGFTLFARKPKANLQTTSEFVLANYPSISKEEEERKVQEEKERDPLFHMELPGFFFSSKPPLG